MFSKHDSNLPGNLRRELVMFHVQLQAAKSADTNFRQHMAQHKANTHMRTAGTG
jgi:hypothetical protein